MGIFDDMIWIVIESGQTQQCEWSSIDRPRSSSRLWNAGLGQQVVVAWGTPVLLLLSAVLTEADNDTGSDMALPLLQKSCSILFGRVHDRRLWASLLTTEYVKSWLARAAVTMTRATSLQKRPIGCLGRQPGFQ